MPALPAYLKQIPVICGVCCWVRGTATKAEMKQIQERNGLFHIQGGFSLWKNSDSDEQCSSLGNLALQITFKLKFYIQFKKKNATLIVNFKGK